MQFKKWWGEFVFTCFPFSTFNQFYDIKNTGPSPHPCYNASSFQTSLILSLKVEFNEKIWFNFKND